MELWRKPFVTLTTRTFFGVAACVWATKRQAVASVNRSLTSFGRGLLFIVIMANRISNHTHLRLCESGWHSFSLNSEGVKDSFGHDVVGAAPRASAEFTVTLHKC